LILNTFQPASDLGIRIGLHSGPVTAGILRGEKSRFQLFGDTVNICAKMESTSSFNRIHISQQTADLLIVAGKTSWIEKKENAVPDDVETYWLTFSDRIGSRRIGSEKGSSEVTSTHHPESESIDDIIRVAQIVSDTRNRYISNEIYESINHVASNEKTTRLVDWNADMLLRLLKQIIAFRHATEKNKSNHSKDSFFRRSSYALPAPTFGSDIPIGEIDGDSSTDTVINEVLEIIDIPEFDVRVTHDSLDPSTVELDDVICQELKAYVKTIALLYRDNPFHNYEHASHVTMSVAKLLSRIVAPDRILNEPTEAGNNDGVITSYHQQNITMASTLHDHTHGITSNPMIQFACVFAALIHDVDHPGR
jgi:Adenylate and Guanylate cyclase catalytic domain